MNKRNYLKFSLYIFTALLLPCLVWAQQQSGNEKSPKNATYLSKNNKNRIIEYNTPFRVIQESSSLGMPTLYGSLIYYTGWESIDESERDFGIYSFPAQSNTTTSLVAKTGLNVLTGTLTDKYYYTITREFASNGAIQSIKLTEFNPETWQINSEVELEPDWQYLPLIITYDKTNSNIYALGYSDDWSEHTLNIMDPDSGEMTMIGAMGEVGIMPNIYAMSAANDGNIYAICSDGKLYSVDKSSAKMTAVGDLGLKPSALQSSVYDYSTNTLYWAASLESGESKLCSVDITTGKATIISDFKNYEEFVGLFIPFENVDPNAPQKVTADFQFTNPGELSGTLSYTSPKYTVAGDVISTDINLTIKVDDTEVKNINVSPGETGSITLSLEEGDHIIVVTPSNDYGEGEKTYLNVYAGIDIPKAVKNLKFDISSSGIATLTWDPVSEGVHNGYLPTEQIRYKVVRNNQSVVAEAMTTTSFSEQLGEEIANYNYTITPYLLDGKEGLPTTTQNIKYGSYVGFPYFEDFESQANVLNNYTFINANNDDEFYTWQWDTDFSSENKVIIYYCSWSDAADDYAITPPFKFEKDKLYTMKFFHSVNDGIYSYVNNLKILAGKEPTAEAMTTELASYTDISNDPTGKGIKELTFSIPDDGVYYLAFYIHSAASQGRFWINDLSIDLLCPAKSPAIVDFDLVVNDKSGDDVVDINLTAPTKDAAGNDLESISQIVIYRNYDSTPIHVINNPIKGNKYAWTDDNPTPGNTHYTLVASNEYGDGPLSTKSVFVVGYVPPYIESFDTEENFNLFTVLNNNNDEMTWRYNDGSARWEYNISYAADDWLISPNIVLQKDRVYKIGFKGRSTEWAEENMRLTIGNDLNTDNHTTLLELTNWSAGKNETHYVYFLPEEDGVHNIGFYAFSKKATLSITIDELFVFDEMPSTAPDAVTNLSAEGDKSGENKATISFNAPTINVKGDQLDSLTKIEIFRNDSESPVYIIDNPTPGKLYSWTDIETSQGNNTYRVVPYNFEGAGIDMTCKVYVGYDVPNVVSNLTIYANDDNSNCTLIWEAPNTGVNGGVLDKESLTYTIYREENGTFVEHKKGLTCLSFTDELNHKGDQKIYVYAVTANNELGQSQEVRTSISLGIPYDIPYVEEFTGIKTSTNPWSMKSLSGYNCSLAMTDYYNGITGYNDDKGMVQFYKWNEDDEIAKAGLISPKISLKKGINPYISFYVYHFNTSNATNYIQPFISVDDQPRQALDEKIYVKAEENGWVKYNYPLSDYIDNKYISLYFDFETSEYETRVILDNISIDDVLDYNLAIESFYGDEIIAVNGASLQAEIRNKGNFDVETFELKLYCDDQEVDVITGDALAVNESRSYEFIIQSPGVTEAGEVRNYHVEVVYDQDMKALDNVSDKLSLTVFTPPYPTISDLQGSAIDYTTTLTWSEPSKINYEPLSDSFEDYKLFAIDNIGDWIMTDVDKQRTISPRYGVTFTNAFEPKAWQVIDPQRINLYGTDVAPHTGHVCLFSMQSDGSHLDGTTTDVCNDDWLISPEIVGGSQLTFWAMQPTSNYGGNEKFEVLYSTTDTDVNNFILIDEVELHNMATWNEYTYTLPEDAKHFAIRHTLSFFGLWLDDITYYPISNFTEMQINSYNIYRDGIKIGNSDTNSYKDNGLEIGTYQYAVTTNFDLGESALSNIINVEVDHTAIDRVDNDNFQIIGGKNNIIINKADGKIVNIFTTDGKLIVSRLAVDKLIIPIESGIYIVAIDNVKKKITVK